MTKLKRIAQLLEEKADSEKIRYNITEDRIDAEITYAKYEVYKEISEIINQIVGD